MVMAYGEYMINKVITEGCEVKYYISYFTGAVVTIPGLFSSIQEAKNYIDRVIYGV
jgi:hypothetical protein